MGAVTPVVATHTSPALITKSTSELACIWVISTELNGKAWVVFISLKAAPETKLVLTTSPDAPQEYKLAVVAKNPCPLSLPESAKCKGVPA